MATSHKVQPSKSIHNIFSPSVSQPTNQRLTGWCGTISVGFLLKASFSGGLRESKEGIADTVSLFKKRSLLNKHQHHPPVRPSLRPVDIYNPRRHLCAFNPCWSSSVLAVQVDVDVGSLKCEQIALIYILPTTWCCCSLSDGPQCKLNGLNSIWSSSRRNDPNLSIPSTGSANLIHTKIRSTYDRIHHPSTCDLVSRKYVYVLSAQHQQSGRAHSGKNMIYECNRALDVIVELECIFQACQCNIHPRVPFDGVQLNFPKSSLDRKNN